MNDFMIGFLSGGLLVTVVVMTCVIVKTMTMNSYLKQVKELTDAIQRRTIRFD